jgi:hypothetical protein
MIKRITLSVVLSLLLACLITAAGVFGAFGPLGYLLEPGSLLCRKFLSSHFTGDVDGDMLTPVIWLNLIVYSFLIFPVLMYTHTLSRKTKDAKP